MRKLAIAVLAVCLCTGLAFADQKTNPQNNPPGNAGPNCDLTGYKSLEQITNADVPDADPVGVRLGPIQFPPDGTVITDVIIDVDMTHTWVGDLNIIVSYDIDCDGTPDVGSVQLLCRVDLGDPLCPVDGCCGSSADLVGLYLFSDGAVAPVGGANDPVPPGCYKPAVESASLLAVFDGFPKNGCWWLNVQDGAGGDLGFVTKWSVHILNDGGGTPVEPSSWGAIKAGYKD